MSRADYKQKSAAKVKVSSIVRASAIYPKGSDRHKTVGMTFPRGEAINVARNILMLATDTKTTGDINLTGYRDTLVVGITSYKRYSRETCTE